MMPHDTRQYPQYLQNLDIFSEEVETKWVELFIKYHLGSLDHRLGNCNKFYFNFEFKIQIRVQIDWIFKRETEYPFMTFRTSWIRIPINQIFWVWPNINKYLQMGENWDQTICNFSSFLNQHCILPYLFANIMFKIGSMSSVLMINDDLNNKPFA